MDGVEVHGGQGHLLEEFLSTYSNPRDDWYGGSFDDRMTLLRDILAEVTEGRAAVGIRMLRSESSPDGIDLKQA